MLTEKGFAGLLGKIRRAEGTMRSLVQEAVEDALAYAIDRQEQGHGLDLRRLSQIQVETTSMKSINSQRLSDYIKTCCVDINGVSAIGWNQKESAYKLLKKGTIVSVPSIDTRGAWYDYGKVQEVKDDFNFSKKLASLLAQAEKHVDKLSEEDAALLRAVRSAKLVPSLHMGSGLTPEQAAEAGVI